MKQLWRLMPNSRWITNEDANAGKENSKSSRGFGTFWLEQLWSKGVSSAQNKRTAGRKRSDQFHSEKLISLIIIIHPPIAPRIALRKQRSILKIARWSKNQSVRGPIPLCKSLDITKVFSTIIKMQKFCF